MRSVTWDDFSAGEHGGEDPRKWPKGAWSGVNVVRYVDGSIGPRAGFKRVRRFQVAETGTFYTVLSGIAAAPTTEAGQRDVWIVGNILGQSQMWSVEVANPSGNSGTVTAVNVEALQLVTSGARLVTRVSSGMALFASAKDAPGGLRQYSPTAVVGIVTNWPKLFGVDIFPAGGEIVILGARLVMAGHYPASIIYSQPNSFLDFGGDLNFIQLSHRYALGLALQRSHMIVASEEGTWSLLTGGAVTSGSLRSITSGEALDVELPPVDARGRAWSFASGPSCPVMFDGSQVSALSRVRMASDDSIVLDVYDQGNFKRYLMSRGVAMSSGGVALMMGTAKILGVGGEVGRHDPRLLLMHHGVWSRHFPRLSRSDVITRYDADCLPGDRLVLSRTFRDAGNIFADVLLADFGLERPPFVNGAIGAHQWEDSYDDDWTAGPLAYGTELHLPQHWDPDTDVVLRGVTIDFKKYSTGDSRTNHFDIKVEAHGRQDRSTLASTQTFSFDEANAGGVSGTDESRTFWFGDQAQGRGFQAHLSNLRGVALRGVTAHYESVGSV